MESPGEPKALESEDEIVLACKNSGDAPKDAAGEVSLEHLDDHASLLGRNHERFIA